MRLLQRPDLSASVLVSCPWWALCFVPLTPKFASTAYLASLQHLSLLLSYQSRRNSTHCLPLTRPPLPLITLSPSLPASLSFRSGSCLTARFTSAKCEAVMLLPTAESCFFLFYVFFSLFIIFFIFFLTRKPPAFRPQECLSVCITLFCFVFPAKQTNRKPRDSCCIMCWKLNWSLIWS